MLFWLCLIVLIVGIVLVTVRDSWVTVIVSGFIMAVMVIVLVGNYIGVNAQVEKLKERYNAITYKVESGACRDEFGLLNKEVIDEIQDWNESITYNKNIQENFWIGIFIPNVYDQFETIDYTKYGRE